MPHHLPSRLLQCSAPAWLLLAVVVCAQTSLGPSIHSVDFQNFDYPYDGQHIHVSNGKWDRVVNNAQENSEEHYAVVKVVYGPLVGDSREQAAVLTADWGVANFQTGHVLVYAMSSGAPALLQELGQSDSSGNNDIDWTRVRDLRIADGQLTIIADEGQCRACTDSIVTAKYRWDGKHFVRASLLRKRATNQSKR